MRYEIEAFDLYSAYAILRLQQEESGKSLKYNGFINITEQIKSGKNSNSYSGLGFLFGYEAEEPGENVNKVQFSIEDHIVKGTKEWLTKYAIAADYPHVENLITIDNKIYYDYKKDAEDNAKRWVASNHRNAHIIITKIPEGFEKRQTSFYYKPSPKQKSGRYIFFS